MQNTALRNYLVLTMTPVWLVSSELNLKITIKAMFGNKYTKCLIFMCLSTR